MAASVTQGVSIALVNEGELRWHRSIVILSMLSNTFRPDHDLGPVVDEYNLCVGLTQASEILCMVGSFNAWKKSLHKTSHFRVFNALVRDLESKDEIIVGDSLISKEFGKITKELPQAVV